MHGNQRRHQIKNLIVRCNLFPIDCIMGRELHKVSKVGHACLLKANGAP